MHYTVIATLQFYKIISSVIQRENQKVLKLCFKFLKGESQILMSVSCETFSYLNGIYAKIDNDFPVLKLCRT